MYNRIVQIYYIYANNFNEMKASTFIRAFLLFILLSATATGKCISEYPTASSVIELIIKQTGVSTLENTVDVIKEGDPSTPVTGIITTMFATMDVLKEAVAKKCNLIIAHEPLYYSHLDDTNQLADNEVFLEKQKYIKEHKLVVWRFHDYIHRMKPDGIGTGMANKLGWKEYMVNGSLNRFKIPNTTLENLLGDLKNKFPKHAFNVVGNRSMTVSGIAFDAGAPGSARHIKDLSDKDVDVLIAGESPQWETYEYARDAIMQGKNKAVIFIGHINSEEAGMEYCATWLKSFITNVPVYFFSGGASFWTY